MIIYCVFCLSYSGCWRRRRCSECWIYGDRHGKHDGRGDSSNKDKGDYAEVEWSIIWGRMLGGDYLSTLMYSIRGIEKIEKHHSSYNSQPLPLRIFISIDPCLPGVPSCITLAFAPLPRRGNGILSVLIFCLVLSDNPTNIVCNAVVLRRIFGQVLIMHPSKPPKIEKKRKRVT